MDKKTFKSLLVSDFNIDILAGYLRNDENNPKIEVVAAPFGQVIPVLVDGNLECRQSDYDCAVVWTQPQMVIPSFQKLIDYREVSLEDILPEVDSYTEALFNLDGQIGSIFVPIWVIPTYYSGYGMLDMKSKTGIANILMRMNLRLAANLQKANNIHLLNTQKWIETVGNDAFNPKLWYMGKIPFDNRVFKEAAKNIKAALNGIMGNAKKLIIVDLDDVMWGGIVGDVGWENIQLGGHDPLGEAFVDFQKALKALTNRGIILGIASKNEESIALNAIDKHPEMVLRSTDFAGWRINWDDKAQNIVDLVTELNLGLQSVVFIDDNPVERARVREALPEVLVPEWPEDKMLYKKALLSLSCFDTPFVSKEDAQRSQMYATEQKRKTQQKKIRSAEEWLKTLEVTVKVEGLNDANRQRTGQLLNKTNQMNLTTRRMTEAELLDWLKEDNRKFWTFRVSDKFGDSGLTGIASLEVNGKIGTIVDFVLSCRVFGRKIENAMLHTITEYAAGLKLEELHAGYIPTLKNKPCLDFLKTSGMESNKKEDLFIWKMDKEYPAPQEEVKYVV